MAGIAGLISSQPGQIITSGLQLYIDPSLSVSYPGSGTSCYDLSPNRYTTTLVNGVTFSTARAPSFGFNGATNNRYVNTGQFLSSETFTLSSWFKSSITTTFQMLFSKEQLAGWPWNYRLFLNQSTGYLTGDIAVNGSNYTGLSYNTNLCDGIWHNAVFVRNVATDTLYLYVDGVSVASTPDITTGSLSNNQNLYIGLSAFTAGGSNPNGSYPMNGHIGQSLVYDIALTPQQIAQNYNATKGKYK